MQRLSDPVYRHRFFQVAADALLCALAFFLAFRLRFLDTPSGVPARYDEVILGSITCVAIVKALIFTLMGLHQTWWRYFRLAGVWSIVRAALVASILLVLFFVFVKPFYAVAPGESHESATQMPRSVVILDLILTVVLLSGARALVRFTLLERRVRTAAAGSGRTVVIVGAGSGGQAVAHELKVNPDLRSHAIGFIDDDPRKRGMVLDGLKVLGTTDTVGEVFASERPDEVIIAIPSAPGELRGKIVAAARERDIPVRTLPTVFELLRGNVKLSRQLREVRVEDVLGRDPIVMELERVGAYLRDRTVLVTGAGGSIGSELARQIARVRPSKLILLDHAEDNLFEIDREMNEEWHFTSIESVLADCKEPDRMLDVMSRYRPDVVFHAAAYKHVPLMERNPLEAIRNNAIATQVTAETAAAAGAERFVLISTDKAVNPQTVMGASKALAEWVVESCGIRHSATRFTAVRFGNVLGSSGSVVPIFRSQIEHGGPLTLTDERMTRFFMTIPEAVQLVIQAGDLGDGRGEVFVLEMGEPVKIIDLAHNMIRLAGYEPGRDIAVEVTGIRPGEKLHEEFINPDESAEPTSAARIVRAVRGGELDPGSVAATLRAASELVRTGEEADLAARFVALVGSRPSASLSWSNRAE